MQLSTAEVNYLEDIAYQIRRLSIEMITYARWEHIGGSLSMAISWRSCTFIRCRWILPGAGKAGTGLYCQGARLAWAVCNPGARGTSP
jgi:hypothetical protein